MKSHHLGVLLIALVIIGAMSLGGRISLFWSAPGLIFVLGTVLGALIFRYGFSGLSNSFRSKDQRHSLCQYGAQVSFHAGILGTVIGFIQAFAHLDTMNTKITGLAVSLGLTTLFYGSVIALGFLLLSTPLQPSRKRLGEN